MASSVGSVTSGELGLEDIGSVNGDSRLGLAIRTGGGLLVLSCAN